MKNDAKRIAELLKVLSNDNRLLILCTLMQKSMTVSELGEYVDDISQSALSQHLAILKAHGILDNHKSGQNITYFIADSRVKEIIEVIKKNYCKN